ncbi:response regulator [Algibacter amylolyticus]|uniref:histidine kinase n=1 Tax=Algibacter amylolyticus TaxID=1608400 RepID=A0A5M7B664_9FLAO|nr:hybrid sensor histidine kinase/response regulator transcription factor [Algibacter amylolyticus]KAA5824809.1 response regulator [Algibacter amylolyticus]MBB5268927.1 signal transduction histidine kinase/ligand-binding sensor domain-containing protein/AraC-like DNA-binding protein [Algibacter amylolyticus]TSJ75974.1 response regulator [Algibacter amylolyticus]
MNKFIHSAFLIIVLNTTSNLFAQIHFENLNTRAGLSQNTVLSVCQDSLGFMWFGTGKNGLNKYDGNSFTYFKHQQNNINSLSSNHITKLLSGKNGSLWIGTENGLNYYNAFNETITRVNYKTQNGIIYSFDKQVVRSLKKEKNGTLWLVTSAGLFIKSPKDPIFREYTTPLTSPILEIEPLNDGKYLISSGKFVYLFNKNKNELQKTSLIDSNKVAAITTIYKDISGNLFFGNSRNGFAVFLKNENKTIYYLAGESNGLKNGVIRSFCENKKGEVFIGTANGLYIFNSESLKLKGYFSEQKNDVGLSHNSIHSIVKDVSGNLWFGTFSGGVNIKYATNYSFKSFKHSENLNNSISSNIINTFYEDEYGMWIGTDGKSISLLNNGKFKNFVNSNLSSHIKAVYKKDKNHLWLGSHDLGKDDYGLVLFNEDSGLVEKKLFQNFSVYGIQKDKSGMLWLASNTKGLLFLNENTLQLEKRLLPDELKSKTKVITYWKKKDIMFICSTNNIFIYNFNLNQFIEIQDNPLKNSTYEINDLFIDSTDNVWIGTSNGLLKLTHLNLINGNNTIHKLETLNINVKSINEGVNNSIWVSSFEGLSHISKDFTKIQTYDQQYKIQGNEFINKSSYKSKDHTLWFGGNEGFTKFHSSKLEKNLYVPPIVLTKIEIDNKNYLPKDSTGLDIETITFKKRIDLKYYQKNITLTAAALNYIIPNKNQYEWVLSKDNESIINGNSPIININNLNTGSYILSIKASNNDGVWVDSPLELELNILPPWWKSNFAYAIYFFLGACIVMLVRKKYKDRKKILHELELEKIEKIKDKELQEEKLMFFTNVSHEIRTPLTLISGPIHHALSISNNNEITENLLIAEKNTNYLKELVNQILDFRKIEKNAKSLKLFRTDINAFIENICYSFNNPSANSNTNITFNSTFENRIFIDRDVINKIVRNLISNAIKFNLNESPILVNLSEKPLKQISKLHNSFSVGKINKKEQIVIITVEDSGIGITKNLLPKIFNRFFQVDDSKNKHLGSGIGLSLVKSLVLLHKGSIKVESEHNKGTRFTVTLPINKDYYNSEEFVFKSETIEKQKTEKIAYKIKENKLEIIKNKNTVLLVDDNEELLNWMVSFLSKEFNCLTAENGKKAINIANKMNPDIIVSDVMMPKMNGFEICKTLKNKINTSHIPIILLTAKTFEEDVKEGFDSGANSYINKPFNPEILIKTIGNFINLKKTIVDKYNANYRDSSLIEKLSIHDRKIIDKANSYIESNISDTNMSVEKMASDLAMSRSTLFRKIKVITNTSPNDYIKNYRLSIALELIKEKEYSINEISEKVGFNDFYYFRKCFIQKFGVKPDYV